MRHDIPGIAVAMVSLPCPLSPQEQTSSRRFAEKSAENIKHSFIQRFATAPEGLIAKGYGDNRPLTTNDTEEGRSRNQRVEVRPLR